MQRQLFGVWQATAPLSVGVAIELSPATEVWADVFGIDFGTGALGAYPGGTLKAGDYVEVFAEQEFTNDSGFNTGIITSLTLTNGAPWGNEALFGTHPSPNAGVYLANPNGGDVNTSTIHHWPVTRIGGLVLPDDTFAKIACFRMRVAAQSTDANSTAIPITIMPSGYGGMTLKVFR